jgi:hypothetical protein
LPNVENYETAGDYLFVTNSSGQERDSVKINI